jgi:hypothetical protein
MAFTTSGTPGPWPAMHVAAASSTWAPSSASSRHSCTDRFGPAPAFMAWVTTRRPRPAKARATAKCSAVEVWPVAAMAPCSATRARISSTSGFSAPRSSSSSIPGAVRPSIADTPFSTSCWLEIVGSHTMAAPSRSAVSTAVGLSPPTKWSQQIEPYARTPGTIWPTA